MDLMASTTKGGVTQPELLYPVWTLPRSTLGKVTGFLPMIGLSVCLVASVYFRYPDVNWTDCGRRHWIPSLSAATGLAPQRYVWQLCIALHTAPKFLVGFAYYNYYGKKADGVPAKQKQVFRALNKLTLILHCLEVLSLCFVNCVTNEENYGLHEKMFALYLTVSVFHMYFALLMCKWAHPEPREARVAFCYSVKKTLYLSTWSFVICVVYFHLRHRFYCEPGAFDLFAFCEYGIAVTNLFYNQTAMYELSDALLYLAKPVDELPAEEAFQPMAAAEK